MQHTEETEYFPTRPNKHYGLTVISCVVFIAICAIVVLCRKYGV